MIPLRLRVILICCCIAGLFYIVRKIRASKFHISDSIYWIVTALLLLLLALFPDIAAFFSNLLGIKTPLNFILLVTLALMALKMFLMSVKISRLTEQIRTLAQQAAFKDYESRRGKDAEGGGG